MEPTIHPYLFRCLLLAFIITLASIIYAYSNNRKRAASDPKRQDYHPFAIVLSPFLVLLFPLFLLGGILLFVLRALLFAGFLLVFAFLLLTLRKPFLFDWWHKFATTIGDPLLKATSYMIHMAFSPWKANPQLL